MKDEINYWKISSIILILLIVVLSFNLLFPSQDYEIDGIKIKKSTVNDFSSVMNDKPFKLCDTSENDKCLIFARIK